MEDKELTLMSIAVLEFLLGFALRSTSDSRSLSLSKLLLLLVSSKRFLVESSLMSGSRIKLSSELTCLTGSLLFR
uniref:Uncharacterized protein n=1 Tax=Anguilla anguilla TaxID=7936 RepID=A0A0E9QI08_ANGAN